MAVTEGRPHAAAFFRPGELFCCLCAVCATAVLYAGGLLNLSETVAAGVSVTVLTGFWLALALRRRAVSRWRWTDGVLYFTRGAVRRAETVFQTDRLLYAETLRSPLWPGGARVKLYAQASRVPVFSAVLPRAQADALNGLLLRSEQSGNVRGDRRISFGRYAALPSAMSDTGVLICLIGAAVFALAGRGRFLMNVTAVLLWGGAFVRMLWRLTAEGSLSVNRTEDGWVIERGIICRRHLYIPDRSVTGVRESRTLPALLCGAKRVELLCGGRIIPCMRWVVPDGTEGEGEGVSPARGLLGCEGVSFAVLHNPRAVRRRYFLTGTALLCGTALAASGSLTRLRSAGNIGVFAAALGLWGVTGCVLQCAAGMLAGRMSGIAVSPSCVSASGMGRLTAETLTLRRGRLSEVRVSRRFADRMNGLCTAELIPEGFRRGVRCSCLPYDRAEALLERFG